MAAAWIRFRSELRSRWRSWLMLALVAGLLGGLITAAAAGARRTDTALERARLAYRVSDAYVLSGFGGTKRLDHDAVERLPNVVQSERSADLLFVGRTGEGRPIPAFEAEVNTFVGIPEPWATAPDRARMLSGRYLRMNRVDEAVVGAGAARQFGLEVGSTLKLRFVTPEEDRRYASDVVEFDPVADPETTGTGPLVTFRVVGVQADLVAFPLIQLTPAFYRAYKHDLVTFTASSIRLKRGAADLPAFRADVERLAQGEPFDFVVPWAIGQNTQRSVHVQVQALWLMTVLGAAGALLVIVQTLMRQSAIESRDDTSLAALGMTSNQFLLIRLARATLVALGAGVLSAVVAVALSPLAPIGAARTAEPHPGVDVDPLAIGAVAALVAGAVLTASAIAGRSRTRTSETAVRGRRGAIRVGDLLAHAGFGASAVAGVRMALERGRDPVPVRSAIAGAAVAVATACVALTLTASLDRLTSTPRLYGHNWDVFGPGPGGPDVGDELIATASQDPAIDGLAVGTIWELGVRGRRIGILAIDVAKGAVEPVVLEGRAPVGPDEILLGTTTLEVLDAPIGGLVEADSGGDVVVRFRVVGRGVMPEFTNIVPGLSLDKGAAITFQGLRRLVRAPPRNLLLADLAEGADETAVLQRLERRESGFVPPRQPFDIRNLNRVSAMPYLVAGVFGAVAAAALLHTLLTLVRRRARDVAVLKTLGFTRRQALAAVCVQATTVAAVGLLVGVPVGIAAGRWTWRLFAHQLGVVPEPVTPIGLILLVIPTALLLANIVAWLPGRVAARTRPALVLRAE